ncbi:MAG: porin [Planctomycetaceae bacterium]
MNAQQLAPGTSRVAFFDDEAAAAADPLQAQINDLIARNEKLTENYDSLSENFEKLQESHDELQEGHDDFLSAFKKGKGVTVPGSSNVTLKINGRIHADYWAFPAHDRGTEVLEGGDPQDRFGFRRVRLSFRGDIGDNMLYRFDPEINNPDDWEWRDVLIGWKNLPGNHTLLVGNQKRPYGLDHLNSSNDNIFLERPMVVDYVNEDARRLGVCLYGFSEDEAWNWRAGVYNGDKVQDSDDFYVSDNYQLEVAGRLANTWWWDEHSDGRGYGHWAVSGAVAQCDGDGPRNRADFFVRPEARSTNRWIDTDPIATATWYQVIGVEQVFNVGPLQIVGEAMNVSVQRDVGSNLNFWGAYGYVSYMLTGEHMEWDRESSTLDGVTPFENVVLIDRCCGGTGGGWGAWQVAGRYSFMDSSDGDILGGMGHSATLGLVWYMNPNAKVQFNYIHGWIVDNQNLAAAAIDEAQYDILGVRCLIAF